MNKEQFYERLVAIHKEAIFAAMKGRKEKDRLTPRKREFALIEAIRTLLNDMEEND